MALERPGRIRRRYDIESPGVRADRHDVLAREIARDLLGLTRLRRHPPFWIGLQLGLGPARVEEDDISFAHRSALLLLHRLNIVYAEELARLHMLDAQVSRHVEHDAAGDDGGDLLDAELGQSGKKGEVLGVVAVVIDAARRPYMAEPVDLRPDAEPALEDIVVIGGVRKGDAAHLLIRLHHLQHETARRKRRRRRVDGDAQAIGLARPDELRSRQHGFRRNEVGVPYFVVRAPARRFAGVLGERARRDGRRQQEWQASRPPGSYVVHEISPCPCRCRSHDMDRRARRARL